MGLTVTTTAPTASTGDHHRAGSTPATSASAIVAFAVAVILPRQLPGRMRGSLDDPSSYRSARLVDVAGHGLPAGSSRSGVGPLRNVGPGGAVGYDRPPISDPLPASEVRSHHERLRSYPDHAAYVDRRTVRGRPGRRHGA